MMMCSRCWTRMARVKKFHLLACCVQRNCLVQGSFFGCVHGHSTGGNNNAFRFALRCACAEMQVLPAPPSKFPCCATDVCMCMCVGLRLDCVCECVSVCVCVCVCVIFAV